MKPRTKKLLACALTAAAATAVGSTSSKKSDASDHVDGVKTAIDIAADLTDVFAFTSPRDPNKVVLVMDAHGLAFSNSRFSNAVDYQFRIRPIADARSLVPSSDASKEARVVCNFSGGIPLIDGEQRGTCAFHLVGGDETVTFSTRTGSYYAGGDGEKNGIKVFAGVRSDPWFLDLGKTIKLNDGKAIDPGGGADGLWGQNILSIVVEIDKSRLPGPLMAVTAQTVRK